MSDLELYKILENFNNLDSATDKLKPVVEDDLEETNTQVQKMGNKIKVTSDGDTTEFDDEETAAAFMGNADDDNQFTTESGDVIESADEQYTECPFCHKDILSTKINKHRKDEHNKPPASAEEMVAEGFGDYDDFDDTPMADSSGGVEYATFDANNPMHRKRLQNGTPIVLSQENFSNPKGDRTGLFISRSPSGDYAKVIRNVDGREINVHLSDIVSADLVNNSIYEEYGINFDLLLAEATGGPFKSKAEATKDAHSEIGGGKEGTNFSLKKKDDGWHWDEKLNEEITMTQTSNLENPENDTTTITGIGPDAGDELAAMMANAGLNTGEYDTMDSPPIESGEVVDMGEPEPETVMASVGDEYEEEPLEYNDEENMAREADWEEWKDNYNKGLIPESPEEDADEDAWMNADIAIDDMSSANHRLGSDDEDGYAASSIYGQSANESFDDEEIDMKEPTDDDLSQIDAMGDDYRDEYMDEDRDIKHANTPDELIAKLDAIITGTSGGENRPKRMFSPYRQGDNPMTMAEGEEKKCPDCDGAGTTDDGSTGTRGVETCTTCGGSGKVTEMCEAEENKLVNEHEDVDGFLDLYKEFSVRGEKR